jgi:hypothetical protein
MGREKDKTRGGWKGIKIKDLQPPFYKKTCPCRILRSYPPLWRLHPEAWIYAHSKPDDK